MSTTPIGQAILRGLCEALAFERGEIADVRVTRRERPNEPHELLEREPEPKRGRR